MTDAITWGQFQWIVGGLVGLIITVFGYAFQASRSKAGAESVKRLWDSHNSDKENLANYKTEVAKTHVTHSDIQSLELRLTRHFDEKWADIKSDLRELKRRTPEGDR